MQLTIDPIEAQARMLATALEWLMAPRPAPPIEAEAKESEEEVPMTGNTYGDIPGSPSDYVSMPRDPAVSGAAAGEEV